jgi:hypothetical protein
MPAVGYPYRLPSDGAYIFTKATVSEGRQFAAGDPLPLDAAVRSHSHKLEILYRNRFIRPTAGSLAVQADTTPDLSWLTQEDLKSLCKLRSLSVGGSTDALRKRLSAVLG